MSLFACLKIINVPVGEAQFDWKHLTCSACLAGYRFWPYPFSLLKME